MKEDIEGFRYVYRHIRELKPINAIFKEYSQEAYIQIEEIDLPKVLKEKEQEVVSYFISKTASAKTNEGYVYKSSFQMRYIGIGVYAEESYRGHLILGPYLSNGYDGDEWAVKILEVNQVEINQRRKIIETYNMLPVLEVAQEIAFLNIMKGLWGIRGISMRYNSPDEEIRIELPKKYYENESQQIERIILIRHHEAEKKVLYYISQGDEKRAIQALYGLRCSLVKGKIAPYNCFKNLILTLNGMIKGMMDTDLIDIEVLYYTAGNIAFQIEQCKNTAQLQAYLKDMIKLYCKLVNEAKTPGYSALISRATQYIRFNFEEELNLKKVAKELFVHPNYLSRKFKEETGHQISDYINKIRVEQAQLLLNETEWSITDIAYSVGYNDEKYFSKVFKKVNQKTPREYRSS